MNDPFNNDFEWPDPTHDIHTPTRDFRVVSGISWQQNNGLLGRIMGFRRAADILHQSMTSEYSRRDLDTVVFPYVWCWRHYLELQLKSLLASFKALNDEPLQARRTHKINQLWNELRPLIIRFEPGSKSDVKNVSRVIEQISNLDPNGESFRYDTNNDGTKTLDGVDGINLADLHKAISGVANFLEAADSAVEVALDGKNEMESYYLAEFGDFTQEW